MAAPGGFNRPGADFYRNLNRRPGDPVPGQVPNTVNPSTPAPPNPPAPNAAPAGAPPAPPVPAPIPAPPQAAAPTSPAAPIPAPPVPAPPAQSTPAPTDRSAQPPAQQPQPTVPPGQTPKDQQTQPQPPGEKITEKVTTEKTTTPQTETAQQPVAQVFKLDKVPTVEDFNMMPPGSQVQTPYGMASRNPDGTIAHTLSPEGQVKYQQAISAKQAKFTTPKMIQGVPGLPPPPVELGKPSFDPFSGRWIED